MSGAEGRQQELSLAFILACLGREASGIGLICVPISACLRRFLASVSGGLMQAAFVRLIPFLGLGLCNAF